MSTDPLKVIAGAPDRPLVIGEIEIPCYVLEEETRVLSQSGMFLALGLARRGLVSTKDGAQIPRFAASRAISPFISNELITGLSNPIIFAGPTRPTYGFPATILVDICDAVLKARQSGSLDRQQKHLAERCEILVRGFAHLGIIALVDEATGYQQIREQRALAIILEKFIAKELQPWTKTFPFGFYTEIARLKEWPQIYSIKRPSVIGHYTNDIVYDRIAPGLLEELRRVNPPLPTGRRKHRHHQWFTPDPGHPKLKEHLASVAALMRASPNWNAFQRNLQRAFPRLNNNMLLPIDD